MNTRYLNVDLDIVSDAPLDAVVRAMRKNVVVLHLGRIGRRHEAHLELASSRTRMTAERTVRRLVDLVNRLPSRHRAMWDAARSRAFNVGIEAGTQPRSYELRLEPATLRAAADVAADLVVTVYAPDVKTLRVPRAPKRPVAPGRLQS